MSGVHDQTVWKCSKPNGRAWCPMRARSMATAPFRPSVDRGRGRHGGPCSDFMSLELDSRRRSNEASGTIGTQGRQRFDPPARDHSRDCHISIAARLAYAITAPH